MATGTAHPTDPDIRTAQVAEVYGQVPLAVGVTIVNAVLLAVLMRAAGPAPGAVTWVGGVVAFGLLRLLVWQAWRRATPEGRARRRWALASVLSAAAAGLLWGGGAVLLWPDAPGDRLFWVFVVGGMCTGAAALHFAHLPTALSFILPAGLPIAALFARDGGDRGLVGAAMILLYLATLALVSAQSNLHWKEQARLRLDLRRREAELDAANEKLRREIAEHRATADSLHHAQKLEALGQLTGGIAHDFNNLLMVVLGSLSLLRKRVPEEDARARRLIENAVQGAERGAALTQRLLAFGRRQTLRPEPVAFVDLLGGMGDLLERSIGPGHRLEVTLPPDLPPALVDRSQLELALLNLVLNARDAMPSGGPIGITARPDASDAGEGRVVLVVSDQGVGMDEATLARATEPFFTTKGVGKGTGLGLSMVHGLAEQSGGRLVLMSVEGAGTVAELWLPRAEGEARVAAPLAEAGAAAVPRRRVLLVDDDRLVLASTAAMLEDIGHAVVEADSGPAALTKLEGQQVDLVLADYGMPGMTGIALAAEIRRRWPALPVILATGYGELPAGAPSDLATLSKPFSQQALGAAIAAALRGAV
ncbi:ATP-binding protein [Roseomonas sp. AR75]|uniref:ATP-binding protein n=1 Tax=Roseomonas sp. AR75 TaxID=2562311 RepID=UPI001F0D8A2D|nr:ATP-binding protein [Roseomonas sp. AR75]